MGRVRQRLVDDAAGKRAATEARKQRDLKKFGKAVQVAKQQERDKAKRDTLDQINVLKRSMSIISYTICNC
jgi:rRNA-processing protein EBP2